MSKKKITPNFLDRRFYPGGAASWTAIETDDFEEIVYSELRKGFPGIPHAGEIRPDTPLRKFLFLKIPAEMGRTQAQNILADAWGRIKREPGRADWKRYQGILDRLDADVAAWDARFEDYSYDDIVKCVSDRLKQIEPLVEATIEQARQQSRQKWGTSTNSAKRKKATARKIEKLVKAERTKGHKIETAFGNVGDSLGLSMESIRRYYYSK